jgi:hypothetical protein
MDALGADRDRSISFSSDFNRVFTSRPIASFVAPMNCGTPARDTVRRSTTTMSTS